MIQREAASVEKTISFQADLESASPYVQTLGRSYGLYVGKTPRSA